MEFICDLARCITITTVIITIVEMMIPEGEIKKVTLFVTGVVASASIVIPMISLFDKGVEANEIFALDDFIADSKFVGIENTIRLSQIRLIEEEYSQNILKEVNGYYGEERIKAVRVYLKTDFEDKIEDIDKVIVTINKGDVEELKRSINRICEISMDKIDVVEEE